MGEKSPRYRGVSGRWCDGLFVVQVDELEQVLVALLGVLFVLREQDSGALRELAGQTAVTGLVHQELLIAAGRCLGVERELLLGGRVEAEHVPVTAVDSLLHFLLAVGHAALDGVHLAGCVANDQGRAVIGFRFLDGLQGLRGVGAHGDLGHVDITVGHGNLREGLRLGLLAGSRELCDLADVGSLGSLSAGVGVDLGVEHEDVDVFAGGEDMVDAAEADVVSPAVAAEDPDGLLGQVGLLREDLSAQLAGVAVAVLFALGLQFGSMRGELRHLGQLVHGADVLFEGRDVGLGGLGVGVEIVDGVEVLLRGGLEVGVRPLDGDERLGLLNQAVTDGLLAEVHAEAMLRVVLEQGVAPCRAVAFGVRAVGGGSARAAPDGRAAGGVGDIHLVAEELSHETSIAGLGAACAGAGELKQRLAELAALDVGRLELLLLGDLLDAVVEHVLLIELGFLRDHLESLHLFGASADADAAAHAVQRGDGHGELIDTLALAGLDRHDLGGGGRVLGFLVGQCNGTDGGVRADIGAVAALDALRGVPFRNGDGNAALLISGSAEFELAVDMIQERGHRQAVAVHLVDREQEILDLLDQLRLALERVVDDDIFRGRPIGGNLDLDIGGSAGVDGLMVHLDDVHALLGVGLRGLLLHVLDGLCLGQNLGQGEERGLQNGVGALAHTDLLRQVDGVDGVELDVVLGNVALGSGIQMMGQLFRRPLTVDHEHAARLNVTHDREALRDVGRVVAGDEVGLVDVVRTLDGLVAEAQMADGDAAGLLGVILEVGLDILVGMVADDLDGVLVRADGAVAAKTPELALDGAFGRGVRAVLVLFEGEVRDVVDDADGELMLGRILLQLIVDRKHGRGRRVLAAEAVTAADDGRLHAGVGQSGDNIHVERFADGAGLLRAVEHGDLLGGSRDGRDELVSSRTDGTGEPSRGRPFRRGRSCSR